MISSGEDLGNFTVPYPEETSPDRGGGPIRRAHQFLSLTPYSMTLEPTPIMRTPHGVGNDPEPGNNWLPELLTTKMLPDGRIVDQTALRGFGAEPGPDDVLVPSFMQTPVKLPGVSLWGAAFGAVLTGSLLGFALASPGARMRGTGKGAVMAGATVAILVGSSLLPKDGALGAMSMVATGAGVGATAGLLYGTPGARGPAVRKGALAGGLGAVGLASIGAGLLVK